MPWTLSILSVVNFFSANKTWHFMWLICQADNAHVMSSLIFAEIRKILRKYYLLNMLNAWRFNPWQGGNTFCCHVDAFFATLYLLSDQVATTCCLWKKLISNTDISWNYSQLHYSDIRDPNINVYQLSYSDWLVEINATDKRGYPRNIFLIPPQKYMLWVLIRFRSASARRF